MNYYLSRLGRSKYAKYVVPVASCTLTGAYFCFHSLGHGLVRELFVDRYPDSTPVEVSDYLRDLITNVFNEVEKKDFHVDHLHLKRVDFGKPTIRWFISSTPDPVVLGTTDFKTGISIGVPRSYDYRRPEDLPDYLFENRRLALFRWPHTSEEAPKLSTEEASLMNKDRHSAVLIRRIDRNSEEGKEYTDSLLLSENAKRFSIAKELYYCDSDRPLILGLIIGLATMGAHATARAHVQVLKLADRHIFNRLPGYALSGLLFFGIYNFLSDAVEEYLESRAIEKAKKLSDDYAAGAEELFKKRAIRDDILGIKRSKYI